MSGSSMRNPMLGITVKWLYFGRVLISLCSRFPFYRENKYPANINIGVTREKLSGKWDHNSHCPYSGPIM
jgi:hypothetical protein